MDVEKRMNLSLDAIIKQGSKKGKSGQAAGPRGRGKVRIEKLSGQKGKRRDQEKKLSKNQKLNQSLSKTLGVQKKGLKVQSGGRRSGTAKPQLRRDAKGGKVRLGKGGPSRRPEPLGKASRRVSKDAKGRGSAKRTVELPKLTDLRITISNTKASSTPGYPLTTMGAPGFQTQMYQSQPMWGVSAPVAAPQPAYGFGPRNMQAREPYSRAVPEVPVPRSRMDFGVSRRALGIQQSVARRAYKDFDDPSQNKSYMRMDTR